MGKENFEIPANLVNDIPTHENGAPEHMMNENGSFIASGSPQAMIRQKGALPEAPGVPDISKIRNFEQMVAKDQNFANLADKNKTKKSKRFNFNFEELVPLPSGGKIYSGVTKDEDILSGFIRMRNMTIEEEEILSTSRFVKTGSTTRNILARCIVSDIDAKDITMFDANFILFYLRKMSYGNEYKFKLECQSSSCEKEFEHTIKISELEFEELPEDFEEPITVKLPVSGFTVVSILPRLVHSEELYKRRSSRKKGTEDVDSKTVDNLMITTVAIFDRDGEKVENKYWEEFFGALPGIDRAALTEKTRFSTGIDELHDLQCPYCQSKYEGSIPVGLEFFRL